MLQQELSETYVLEHSSEYLQILDEQGNWIYRGGFLKRNQLPAMASAQLPIPLYKDRRIGGQSFRFLSEVVEASGRRFVIQAATPNNYILRTPGLFQRDLPLVTATMLLLAQESVIG